jgi:hypothetical protein
MRFLTGLRDSEIVEILGDEKEWKDIQNLQDMFSDSVIESVSSHPCEVVNKCNTNDLETSCDFPEKLYEFMEERPHLYTKSKLARPIAGENEWVRSELIKIVEMGHVRSSSEAINDFIKIYPRLSRLSELTLDQFQCRYGTYENLLDSASRHDVDSISDSILEPQQHGTWQCSGMSKNDDVEESSGLESRRSQALESKVPQSSAKGPAQVNLSLSFPERLYDYMDSNPGLYTAPDVPVPIPGENEWIRSVISKSLMMDYVMRNWDSARQDVVMKHPRLSFIMKLGQQQCVHRYGCLKGIMEDHKSDQPTEGQTKWVTSLLRKAAKLDHVTNMARAVKEVIESHPELSYLSRVPKNQRIIRYGSFERLQMDIDQPPPPKRVKRVKEPRSQAKRGLDLKGLDNIEAQFEGDYGLEIDSSFVPTPMRSIGSEDPRSTGKAFSHCMSALFDSPSEPGARLFASTTHSPVTSPRVPVELRRSPRIQMKQQGRLSFP